MGTTQSDEFGRGTVVAANDASVVASVHTIGDVLDLHVDVAGGHIAPNARADVVSELFELPAVKMSRRLHALSRSATTSSCCNYGAGACRYIHEPLERPASSRQNSPAATNEEKHDE